MLHLIIFLKVFFLTACTPVDKPKQPLAQLTTVEINNLFHEANQKFKSDALETELNRLCENLNGSVLLAFGKQILYKNETGYKRLAKKTPENVIDSETLFELASISKQFTAAAILKLNNEDRLSLTDDVTKFLPLFPYKNITVKHLLTHTSGLPEYMDFPEKDFNQKEALSNSKLESYMERIKPKILSQPGTRFKYINTNYALLALIVEKVAEISFEQYIRTELFAPANLHLTCFATELNTKTNYAKGHLADSSERPFHFQNGVIGDKGVYSTVEEVYRWMQAYFIDYQVLPESIVEQAMRPQNKITKGEPSELYGYGLRIEEDINGYLVYHGGLWRGFHNNMVFRPSDQYIFIVLSNFRNRAAVGVNTRLLGIIDGV